MKSKKNSKGRKTLGSFEELRQEYGLKPVNRQTKDLKKLEKQRNNFSSHHICPICKQPMKYIEGTNIFCCINKNCEGFVKERLIDEETGETEKITSPSFHTLDRKSASIAQNIFKEK